MKKIFFALIVQIILSLNFTTQAQAYSCGQTFPVMDGDSTAGLCQCASSGNQAAFLEYAAVSSSPFVPSVATYCCGFNVNGDCKANSDPLVYTCGESSSDASVPTGATCNCEGGGWEGYFEGWFWNRATCCGFVKDDQCLSANPEEQADDVAICGQSYPSGAKSCICGGGGGEAGMEDGSICCGWVINGKCNSTDVAISDTEVSGETLSGLNPLAIGGSSLDLSTPGKIISRALGSFVFPIAGIILFVVLVLGGFQMLTGAASSKGMEEGKQKITSAILGFIILFAAYWIAQLLELIFGISILS